LVADWLQEFIQLRLTEEIFNEFERRKDPEEIIRLKAFARRFKRLRPHMKAVELCITSLKEQLPIQKKQTSYQSDIRQIAHAIVGRARFFVTRDNDLLKQHDILLDLFGIELVRPCDVILRIDEMANSARYETGRFGGVASLDCRAIKAGEVRQLSQLFHLRGERKADFDSRLQRCLSSPAEYTSKVILDNTVPLALLVQSNDDNSGFLEIPVIRQSHALAPSGLLQHLLFQSVVGAHQKGHRLVRITEPHLTPDAIESLREAGFCKRAHEWVKPVVSRVLSVKQIEGWLAEDDDLPDAVRKIAEEVALATDATDLTSVQKMLELERHCWPLKIVDAPIPTWVVPIKPYWAGQLFEERIAQGQLFGAKKDLILRNDNVYYRAKGNQKLIAPARLLWYVSSAHHEPYSGSISACSLMSDVQIDKPSPLFRSLRRGGVFKWQNVLETAGGDLQKEIMAFRFRDTELLTPISLEFLRKIVSQETGRQPNLVSPFKISAACFEQLYREGRGNVLSGR
ncbi:MAG: hypothetical protein ACKO6N_30030, partial [Myxococcota bacterium]